MTDATPNGLEASIHATLSTCFRIAPEEAAALAGELGHRALSGGDWLFRQGEPGDSLFLLVRGRLAAWREEAGSTPVQLGEVAPGESVGEVGLLTGQPRSASIRAIRDSVLVEIRRSRFEDLARRHPMLSLEIAGLVARRLHERTTGATRAPRPRVIALRPLDDRPELTRACDAVVAALARHRPVLDLAPETLAAAGAPPLETHDAAPDEALRQWIAAAEEQHECVFLRCAPRDTAWTGFAQRQADLVLCLACAEDAPEPRAFELEGEDAETPFRAPRALVLLHGPDRAIAGTARWLAPRALDFHLHVRAEHEDADIERIARVLAGTATGLVLGGGAARGFAHLGVYRALVERGVPVDWVGGTSIGAIIGAGIAQALDPLETIERARIAFVDGKPFDDYTIPLVSILRGERMVNLSKKHLAGDVEDLPLPFYCVSSNMNSGLANEHDSGPVWRAISASAALPGVLPPVVHEGELAVDGAVLDNLPVDAMRRRPVGRVVAVELSTRDDHKVDYEDLPSPWALLRQRMLPFGSSVDVPGLATLLLRGISIGSKASVAEQGTRADLLLRPPVQAFGLLSVAQFDEVVEAGYRDALERIDAWQDEGE